MRGDWCQTQASDQLIAVWSISGWSIISSPRAFYCIKMCEKSKSTTFLYYKILPTGKLAVGTFYTSDLFQVDELEEKNQKERMLRRVGK